MSMVKRYHERYTHSIYSTKLCLTKHLASLIKSSGEDNGHELNLDILKRKTLQL